MPEEAMTNIIEKHKSIWKYKISIRRQKCQIALNGGSSKYSERAKAFLTWSRKKCFEDQHHQSNKEKEKMVINILLKMNVYRATKDNKQTKNGEKE